MMNNDASTRQKKNFEKKLSKSVQKNCQNNSFGSLGKVGEWSQGFLISKKFEKKMLIFLILKL